MGLNIRCKIRDGLRVCLFRCSLSFVAHSKQARDGTRGFKKKGALITFHHSYQPEYRLALFGMKIASQATWPSPVPRPGLAFRLMKRFVSLV